MKRFFRWTALLTALLCLSGCSALRENNDLTGLELPRTQYVETGSATRTITPSLYYLESSSKLGIETRELTLRQDDDEAQVILEALLQSPARSGLSRPASGLTLDKVERSGEFMNVYLYSAGGISQVRRFFICASVTNTLVDYFDVLYVCVFINNEPLSINDYPYGAMQKTSENVLEEYQQCLARYESEADMEIMLPIYFTDETQKYLFPEMRAVRLKKNGFSREQLAAELMEELAAGPKVNYSLKSQFLPKTEETDMVSVQYDTSVNTLKIFYSYEPTDAGLPASTACAAVFRSLENIFSGMMRMTIHYREEYASISRAVSRTLLGSTITLYFPDAEGEMLLPVSRVVYASEAHKCRTYLRELLKGVADAENVSACFPADYDTRDFRGIYIRGNTAYVDFGDQFVSMVTKMDAEQEYLLFYSIVNTLTVIPRVKQVQFTVNEQVMDTAGGEICIAYPLMPNPGMLK